MSIITSVRKARDTDARAIAHIHAQSWQEVYHFMGPKVLASRNFEYRLNQWRRWFEATPKSEALYCLTHSGTVVGFAMAKPNTDDEISARGEFHACYILPQFRGGNSGPLAMQTLAEFLHSEHLWPACVWAFRDNPYRRIYAGIGCRAQVYRDRVIQGQRLPEIGYLVPPYQKLINRLERMRASAVQRQTELPETSLRLERLLG